MLPPWFFDLLAIVATLIGAAASFFVYRQYVTQKEFYNSVDKLNLDIHKLDRRIEALDDKLREVEADLRSALELVDNTRSRVGSIVRNMRRLVEDDDEILNS